MDDVRKWLVEQMCDCVIEDLRLVKVFFWNYNSNSRQRQKWEGLDKNGKSGGRKGRIICTIAVDTEGNDGEDELDSAYREVEIKSHCWEVCM